MISLLGVSLAVPVPVLVVLDLVLGLLEGQVVALEDRWLLWRGRWHSWLNRDGHTQGSHSVGGPLSAMIAYIYSLA